jgi:hypothetical protein
MNNRLESKVIASVLLGVLAGAYWQLRIQQHIHAGRDAFMIYQAQLWDRTYSHPTHVVPLMIVGVGLSACLFGVYELLVRCVSLILEKWSPGANSS